jgi:hypothetical protein
MIIYPNNIRDGDPVPSNDFLFQDVNACYNIESIYISLRDTGRRPPVFGPPAVDEER